MWKNNVNQYQDVQISHLDSTEGHIGLFRTNYEIESSLCSESSSNYLGEFHSIIGHRVALIHDPGAGRSGGVFLRLPRRMVPLPNNLCMSSVNTFTWI